jgi:hypothetical protein
LKVELARLKAVCITFAKNLLRVRLISYSKRISLSLSKLYMKNSPEKFGSMIQRPSQILMGAVGNKKMNFSTIQNNLKNKMAVILRIRLEKISLRLPFHKQLSD